MQTRYFSIFIILSFLFPFFLNGQVKIIEYPQTDLEKVDSLFFDLTSTRHLIHLQKDWIVFPANEHEKRIKVSIPSEVTSESMLIFERQIKFTNEQLINYDPELVFLGLSYSAEISINNVSLYKHPGGAYPFSVRIPKDILNYDTPNTLQVKLQHKIDPETTLPVKPRFLFPKSIGGIFRDVYIHLTPTIYVSGFNWHQKRGVRKDRVKLYLNFNVEKSDQAIIGSEAKNLKCYLQLYNEDKSTILYSKEFRIKFNNLNKVSKKAEVKLIRPKFWSPSSPNHYYLRFVVSNGDSVIDEYKTQLAIKNIKLKENSLYLNGKRLEVEGTTYLESSPFFYQEGYYKSLKSDFEIIKNTGFNAIRFAKKSPHPYELKLCDDLGLLALIEIPLNSLPTELQNDDEMITRAINYTSSFVNEYQHYPAVLAVGLGGSYLPNSDNTVNFIEKLASIVKKNKNILTYASFLDAPEKKIENLDMIGIELYSKNLNLPALNDNAYYFISEATYPTYRGNSNGYSNRFSFEAQAKYFSTVINQSRKNKLLGFFLNSMFDYHGDFASFYSSYTVNNLYKIGILGENRATDRISYNLIKSKLKGGTKITIPVGSSKDDTPLLFIVASLVLSIFLGLIINSKRKFREDSIRALLRPYNFFADIRDQRILSGFNTNALMILLGGTHALLLTNLLYYFKNNILLEKISVSFGSYTFVKLLSNLAWHPTEAFIYFFIFSIVLFFVFTLIFKFGSFFIRNRVLLSSIYYAVIWAFLPLALLLPVEIVLYKILAVNIVNIFIFIFLIFYALWLIQRLLKGIYVIFDTRAFNVYLISIIVIVIFSIGIMFYFQIKEDTIYYLLNALKQYKFI